MTILKNRNTSLCQSNTYRFGAAFCISALLLVLLGGISTAAAQDNTPLQDQFLETVKTEPIYLTGIFQTFGDLNLDNDYFSGGDSFHIGTARLGLGGRLDRNVDWRVQFRLESSPNLLDAFLTWHLDPLVSLRVGAQKPQVSAEQILSTGTTEFIRRARLSGTQLNSREIGVSLYGEGGMFGYNLGIFNGEGVRSNQDNRFQYLFRGYYHRDLDSGGSVELGANVMTGSCYDLNCSPSSLNMAGNRTTTGVDFRLESGPWLLSAELLTTEAELATPAIDSERINGSHLTGGYTIDEGVRLLARWDWMEYREADTETHLLTVGYDQYLSRLLRFQLNVMADLEQGESTALGATGNIQFRF
ncbi:MAG: porin [Balneolaceae bacterium]